MHLNHGKNEIYGMLKWHYMYIHMRIYENAIIKLHPSFAQFGQLTSWPFN